jgi:uncharacterized protein YpmB
MFIVTRIIIITAVIIIIIIIIIIAINLYWQSQQDYSDG